MAEYFAEGLLNRLLGLESRGVVDGLVHRLLQQYTFYIVPNMNLDGAVLGHIRTNAAGANLNREWTSTENYAAPTLERSPEVYHVLEKMKETGVDCFIDVHGDEELPFNFMAGAAETKNWGPRLQALHGALVASFARANPDLQKEVGYGVPPPGSGDRRPNIATHAIANLFNCLSVTLEMPFKDCQSNPDPERGWNPQRSRKLGASLLDALAYVQPYLRSEEEFWKDLPLDDAYVRTSPRYEDTSAL
jgi:murein tripeptide amidase MpaA